MQQHVTQEHVQLYERDGVVVLRNVLSSELIEELGAGVRANMSSPSAWANEYTPSGSGGRFFDDYVNWQTIPAFQRAALTGVLPGLAAGLLGVARPRFFHEHVLVKEAGTVTPTPWHHDDPYYGVDGVENVSLWVPLDPVPASIALRCIRGSHRWGKRFIPRKFVNQEAYITNAQGFEHLPDPELLENDPNIGIFPAEVGDVVAFHFRTLHSAPGTEHHNAGRRVVSFRYVGDDARWAKRPWTTSPPFPDNGLNPGDLLDEARFPLTN